MKRQALVVALLLCSCDDSKFDPSPMKPIPHGPGDVAPPPAAPPVRPPPAVVPPVAVVEPPPAPLPTTGAFSLSILTTNAQTKRSWRGALKGSSGWTSAMTATEQGLTQAEVRSGELGKEAAALYARLDALNWHLLASGSGKGDNTSTVVTITRGEVTHSFTVDGGCDCPASQAVAAITAALNRLPLSKVSTAVSSAGLQTVKKGARTVDAECQPGLCTPQGSKGAKGQRAYICYPTSQPTIQNCLDAPWKTKGFLVKTATKVPLEPGRKAWALTLGPKVTCEINGAQTAWPCTDGRLVRSVVSGSKAWFAVIEEDQQPLAIAKVFLLPSSTP